MSDTPRLATSKTVFTLPNGITLRTTSQKRYILIGIDSAGKPFIMARSPYIEVVESIANGNARRLAMMFIGDTTNGNVSRYGNAESS